MEANKELANSPAIINSSAQKDGWICKLQVEEKNLKELDSLLDESGYPKERNKQAEVYIENSRYKKLLEETKH